MSRTYGLLLEGCGALAGIVLAFIAAAVTLDVLLRPFGASLIWVFEITELLLLWVTMLALPWVAYKGGHISVDVMISYLPPATARQLKVGVNLFVAALCLLIAYHGWGATAAAWTRGLESAGLMQYPLWLSRIALPFGFGLGGMEFLRQALSGTPEGAQA